jgi:hypothetical protein
MSRAPSKEDAPQPDDGCPAYSPDQLDRMDRKFVNAMLTAIAAGAERCPVGVDTTPGTKRPIFVLKPLPVTTKTNFDDEMLSLGHSRSSKEPGEAGARLGRR